MRQRLAAYSHDTVGLGHLRRTLAICSHLGREVSDLSMLVLSGSPFSQAFGSHDRIDFLKLPSARKIGNGHYESRYLDIDIAALVRLRERVIDESLRGFDPGFLLVDKTPSGMSGELITSLRRIRSYGRRTSVVLGLRDILDEPEYTRREWASSRELEVIDEFYDAVWIYGTKDVFDTAAEYGFPKWLADRTRYLGYIPKYNGDLTHAEVRSRLSLDDRPLIVVTTGGGEDGFPLISLYLDMLADGHGPGGYSSVLVTGPGMSSRHRKIIDERARPLSCRVVEFTNHMTCIVSAAELVVTMGGYNTLTEALALGKRVVSVPRTAPRMEQFIRAQRFESMGLLSLVDLRTARPGDLGDAIRFELNRSPDGRPGLSFTGLALAGEEFTRLTAEPRLIQPDLASRGED